MDTRQINVTGRVQGVGYRDALRREARRLGVTGWVRNRGDGSVEAVVQGSPQAVEAIIAWTQRGPPGARVAAVQSAPLAAEFDRSYSTFELRPTAA
jgi:acylphosphatase